MSGECEQSWYPVGKVAWFTRHVREDIGVTAGQLGRRCPARGELDDAAMARIIGVRRDQAGGLTLHQGRAAAGAPRLGSPWPGGPPSVGMTL